MRGRVCAMFLSAIPSLLKKMRIFVRVKPNSRENRVQKLDENRLVVFVKEPQQEGKANQALIETLSSYFGLPQQNIAIARGRRSKQKIINIDDL